MIEANEYYVKYPCIQVRTWGLLLYHRLEFHRSKKKKTLPLITDSNHSDKNTTDDQNKKYTGKLTEYSRKRLKRAIQLLVATAEEKEAINFKSGKTFKFKVNFITLTLPAPQGDITDKQIKKEVLDVWIKRMRRKHKLKSYVWRAEKQKNKNIHFHLITDTYIHYEKIRRDWNSCLQRFNFIDNFQEKHGHRDPNSTDVHAVWKVKNLTQYFIKYMSKDTPEALEIEGKIWDCSTNLKVKHNCEMILEGEQEQIVSDILSDPEIKIKSDPNFTLIFLSPTQHKRYIKGDLRDKWENYLKSIRDHCSSLGDKPGCGSSG